MNFPNAQPPLPLVGGVVQVQRLVVPHEVIARLPDFRHACRLAWKLARRSRRITYSMLAEVAGLYRPHVSDYFSQHANRRELPAKYVALVERYLGNTVISQWLACQADLTVVEEMQAQREQLRRLG
jgi:hypothetical protein